MSVNMEDLKIAFEHVRFWLGRRFRCFIYHFI